MILKFCSLSKTQLNHFVEANLRIFESIISYTSVFYFVYLYFSVFNKKDLCSIFNRILSACPEINCFRFMFRAWGYKNFVGSDKS